MEPSWHSSVAVRLNIAGAAEPEHFCSEHTPSAYSDFPSQGRNLIRKIAGTLVPGTLKDKSLPLPETHAEKGEGSDCKT